MDKNVITIKGARSHNLKNISLTIPRDKMVVFTGLSGSGKTSLAFDTIYAEGQRRYVESLSAYARQFLGQMEKPDVDFIEGLSPAISIDQKTTSQNPRSTVGTVTEIYDYLRLLFARVGVPHCPRCGRVVEKQTVDQIVDSVSALGEGTRLQVLAPVVRARKGEHTKLLEDARRSGYVRARIDGEVYDLGETPDLVKNKKHTIEIVVDRLVVREGIRQRLSESIETAMQLSGGLVVFAMTDAGGGGDLVFSANFACTDCGISLTEIEPRAFSFNNPAGACPDCSGLGMKMIFDPDLLVPNPALSLAQGAIVAPGWNAIKAENSGSHAIFIALAEVFGFDLNTPYSELSPEIQDIIMHGTDKQMRISYTGQDGQARSYPYTHEGIMNNQWRRYRETASNYMRMEYETLMTQIKCPACKGRRLKPEVLAVTLGETNISGVTEMTIGEVRDFFKALRLNETQLIIAGPILKEIHARTGFLMDVGLDYLTLARAAGSLSGGEAQRIRLATQIGSGLVGVVYILDEPSIGLHQRDNERLLKTLRHLTDIGNTLIVVEHDADTMYAADHIVDIGPRAGVHGGRVVYSGDAKGLLKCKESITGQYLSGKKRIETPATRRPAPDKILRITGAAENNLKNIDVSIPIGVFTCVTGVSGSGKSSLINEILYKRLARDLNRARVKPGKHADITGLQHLDKIISIDQSPIGRTPRSNPATYTGLFDLVRDIFAQTPEAKIRGYQKGRFSFNVKGGRCEACAGDGIIKIEMHFLPDVYVPCEVCHGKRYNRETLEVKYKQKTIAEVLNLTVEDALSFFDALPRLRDKLQTLHDVGLSYIKLGQSSTTLSGGEAQRVKLATELSRRATGKTLYVLDEPTTGLHAADVQKLITILQKLTDWGNTVVVIEHNLDVIKTADHIIDLGPEGGGAGGQVVATGTPEAIAQCEASFTGQFLRPML
ncbi:MAG: excinuclease ABC subunit UvrA [Defluviitaleaceae bacterium]|nr:excinuclease ABC subunit UvrA [Defluviitaleaceae bacterium]MCL2238365.1 excinuclease ABC subunit UvrA [Defluviitaleaceae bacterium]